MTRHRYVAPSTRSKLALAQTGSPWTGGPFSEPARHWLREREGAVGQLLADATQLLEQTARPEASLVVTHGEPHPGNVIGTDRGLVLIDWDTVGLAPPERDLWMFADDERLLAHYTQTTGRSLDPRAIQLYDLAWTLGDLSVMLDDLRSVHEADEDSTQTWRLLERAGDQETLTHFATDGAPLALRAKSMYQPGGVRFRFAGTVSVAPDGVAFGDVRGPRCAGPSPTSA